MVAETFLTTEEVLEYRSGQPPNCLSPHQGGQDSGGPALAASGGFADRHRRLAREPAPARGERPSRGSKAEARAAPGRPRILCRRMRPPFARC